jgi:CRISPR/Cas system-associated endonuclease Cas1
VANGYITQIGLFHDNMFNQFNLGSDLMEPFRPIVDFTVKRMNPQKFEHEEKMEILRILQLEILIANRQETVNNAIKIYTKSIFEALNEKDASLIKFYKYEL